MCMVQNTTFGFPYHKLPQKEVVPVVISCVFAHSIVSLDLRKW